MNLFELFKKMQDRRGHLRDPENTEVCVIAFGVKLRIRSVRWNAKDKRYEIIVGNKVATEEKK